jgi:hypothetical protein
MEFVKALLQRLTKEIPRFQETAERWQKTGGGGKHDLEFWTEAVNGSGRHT